MESVYLKQLANNQPQGEALDVNAPFSFLEWKTRLPAVVDKDAVYQYNDYIIKWFSKNKEKTVSRKVLLRQKYLYLLDQLQLFFSSEEKNTWYSQVNLADEKELLLAIPYFAKKLKEIALYYLKLRKQLKNAKIKYNAVGTTTGLEQEIYTYFLETFSSKNNELSPGTLTTVPSFSALQKSLIVQVEELYDDQQYFDLSPTQPLSSYFNILDTATSNFLATRGIVLSSSEWLFNSFNVPVSTSFDSFFNQLTGTLFELPDETLYTEFVQKYIAENKLSLNFTSETSQNSTTLDYNVSLAQGNNFFYYPYGTTDNSVSISRQFPIVPLSSLDTGGTAGTTIESSDTIFVKVGSEIKGAWLRYVDFEETPKTIKAAVKKNSSSSFIYPFPGYGLSGAELPWTGPGFETNSEYYYLTNELKAQVNNAYWSQTLPQDSCNNLLLNNSTLVNNGATPNANPQFADQVFTRLTRSSDTSMPFGELSGAWLYKFERTALPISPNQDNVIWWPYQTLNPDDTFPEYFKNLSLSGVCIPVSVQDLPKSSCIAAPIFDNADKIYKLPSPDSPIESALECAWLSGSTGVAVEYINVVTTLPGGQTTTIRTPVPVGNYEYVDQEGFAALFSSEGEAVRFVWNGPETDLDNIFYFIPHKKDCPFTTQALSISAYEWQKCTCKQVYHVPFGHSYASIQEGNMRADCVVEDTDYSMDPFDFSSWKDSTQLPFTRSTTAFAWYRTRKTSGWTKGRWVSEARPLLDPFKLRPGKAYFYIRASLPDGTAPPYVVNKDHQTTGNTKWISATLTSDSGWVSNNTASNMMLYPGDFIKYDRQQSSTSYLLSSSLTRNVNENRGSVWSAYDWMPIICGEMNSTTISWPTQTIPFGSTDNQYPDEEFTTISRVDAWRVTKLTGGNPESHYITGLNSITFVPPTTGTYAVSVTATTIYGDKVMYPQGNTTVIPMITAVPEFRSDKVPIEIKTPASGFLIEHLLRGWNYNSGAPDRAAYGGRPYWAVLDSQKTSTTRYKGLYSWGYPDSYVDEYLPNAAPILSPIELTYGSIVEYYRKGYSFVWTQPITYKQYIGIPQWSKIYVDTTKSSNLSILYKIKQNIDPIVIPLNQPTDIKLSNTLNGSPVEVFYYALNEFIWPITVSTSQNENTVAPSASFQFISQTPWANLGNRFYPTIANIPTIEKIYAADDVGGYFLPQHLGASFFINKNYEASLKTLNLSGEMIVEDTSVHVGGRGRTKQDQSTLYTWSENNQWMKESATAANLAGAVKKSLTKTFQTFVPYQSNVQESELGLITTRSRVSPWGGYNDEQWTDVNNEPKSFTGVRNLTAWANSQILKQHEKPIHHWVTDIYGNQYGLYKDLENVSKAEQQDVTGSLWVRTNNQFVSPAQNALSSVFYLFNDPAFATIYSELNGEGIRDVDCYFNTLFIETPSIAIFANIDYNYELSTFETTLDNIRYKQLNNNFKFDANWFFTSEKKVVSLYTQIIGTHFIPVLYELDLSTTKYRKIFPITSADINNLNTELDALNYYTELSRGCIHYNRTSNNFLISYSGKDVSNKMFYVDFHMEYRAALSLTKINFYRDLYNPSAVNLPPIPTTNFNVPINCSNATLMSTGITVTFALDQNPQTIVILNENLPSITVNSATRNFRSNSPLSLGLYHINYTATNSAGTATYCLTLNVVS